MYNAKMKNSFIKDYMKSRVVAQTSLYSLFRKAEPFEEKYKKDCSEFTEKEILNMYEEFEARSKFTVFNYNAILKAYCAWTKYYHGLNNDIAYNNITTEMIAPLIPSDANRVLSREEVNDIEDQLYNYTDRAIIELLFTGVAGKNMEDLYTVSDGCIYGDKLVVNGKVFPMTDRLKELLPKAFAETELTSYSETMRITKVVGIGRIYKERSNARGANTDDAKFRYFYRRIQIVREYLGIPSLTMKNLAAAGLWYNLSIGMQASRLDLRGFLRTPQGKEIAIRYGFSEEYYLDNICAKYE